jgi:prepilin-type N-terminal cleavage/methylation domain-containing protein
MRRVGNFDPRQVFAFTLIELLIVVAIIAILAAIAVPNFLEAQTRAKVSRCRNDFRSIATGLESYAVDNKTYPPDEGISFYFAGDYGVWCMLTTPIAYMSSVLANPFRSRNMPKNPRSSIDTYAYINTDFFKKVLKIPANQFAYIEQSKISYYASSAGPNLLTDFLGLVYPAYPEISSGNSNYLYDPTNGTTSFGDLIGTNVRNY